MAKKTIKKSSPHAHKIAKGKNRIPVLMDILQREREDAYLIKQWGFASGGPIRCYREGEVAKPDVVALRKKMGDKASKSLIRAARLAAKFLAEKEAKKKARKAGKVKGETKTKAKTKTKTSEKALKKTKARKRIGSAPILKQKTAEKAPKAPKKAAAPKAPKVVKAKAKVKTSDRLVTKLRKAMAVATAPAEATPAPAPKKKVKAKKVVAETAEAATV